MKAILFSYNSKGLSKSDSSKICKKLVGYKDNSNNGKYFYERKGLIRKYKGLIIAKSTFVIPENKAKLVFNAIKTKGLKIRKWNINIPKSFFSS